MKDFVSTSATIVQTIAIIIGGGWALYEFGLKREAYTKLSIDLQYEIVARTETHNVLATSIILTNEGATLVKANEFDIRLQRVLPVPDKIDLALKANKVDELYLERSTVVAWPLLDRQLPKYDVEIEPSESHSLYVDFAVKKGVKTARLSAYILNNDKSKDRQFGWIAAKFIDMEDNQ